jgi:hypothetical protein
MKLSITACRIFRKVKGVRTLVSVTMRRRKAKTLRFLLKYGILYLMETAITVDVDILNKAMQAASGQTQRQLVEDALCLFAMQNRQAEARKYRGKLQWEGNLDELRTAKWSL